MFQCPVCSAEFAEFRGACPACGQDLDAPPLYRGSWGIKTLWLAIGLGAGLSVSIAGSDRLGLAVALPVAWAAVVIVAHSRTVRRRRRMCREQATPTSR